MKHRIEGETPNGNEYLKELTVSRTFADQGGDTVTAYTGGQYMRGDTLVGPSGRTIARHCTVETVRKLTAQQIMGRW